MILLVKKNVLFSNKTEVIKDLWSNLKTPTPKEIQCDIENKMQANMKHIS